MEVVVPTGLSSAWCTENVRWPILEFYTAKFLDTVQKLDEDDSLKILNMKVEDLFTKNRL